MIKRLGQSAHRILGVVRKVNRQVRVEPVDRRSKESLTLVPAEAARLEDGDLVLAQVTAEARYGPKRGKVLDKIQEKLAADGGPQTIHLMMHSLAFGTLLPLIGDNPDETVSEAQMDMTLNVMAHSLVYWTQDLMRRRLLGRGSRIFSMTSSGSHRIFARYGAVSAAKAALESHTRQLAYELGPAGVLVNCIQAGVTDTPALRRIPGHERLLEFATTFNPSGRITTEQDVAVTLAALADPRVQWISGSVIVVDGAEDVVGA